MASQTKGQNMIKNIRVLHAAFFTPASDGSWRGLPLLLEGTPGHAKSSTMRAFAAYVGAPVEIAAVGARGEGFFGCTPVARGEGEDLTIRFPRPEWARKFSDSGLVCVDELTTAKGELKAAVLTLTLDGEVSGHVLPAGVRVWGACNPSECSADGEDLSAPNANRFCHLKWAVDAADWCAWMTQGATEGSEAIDYTSEAARVLGEWPRAFAVARSKVAAFISRHPDLLDRMPPEGDPQRGRAWPSPRSWEMAARVLASSTIHSLSETDTDTLGSGCVGVSAWQEFRTYLVSLDLPDPVAVLDGLITWAPNPRRLDVTSVTLAACTAVVTPPTAKDRATRADRLWTILDQVGTAGARDLTIAPATALIKAGFIASPIARKVLADQRLSGISAAIGAKL